jgi:hypothetical protein
MKDGVGGSAKITEIRPGLSPCSSPRVMPPLSCVSLGEPLWVSGNVPRP